MLSIYKKRTVVSAVIASKQDPKKFVVVSRKSNPSLLAIPGGKVDEGEDILTALLREVKEETGLDLIREDVVVLMAMEVVEGKSFWDMVFYAEVDENTDLYTKEELINPRWESIESLIKHGAYPEFNARVVEELTKLRS